MGGSILAQTYNQVGETVPDIDAPQDLRAFFVTIRTLAEAGTILAYHDRSDGGLFATLTEWPSPAAPASRSTWTC